MHLMHGTEVAIPGLSLSGIQIRSIEWFQSIYDTIIQFVICFIINELYAQILLNQLIVSLSVSWPLPVRQIVFNELHEPLVS